MFAVITSGLGLVAYEEYVVKRNIRPLLACAVLVIPCLIALYKFVSTKKTVMPVLRLFEVPIRPGHELRGEIVFDGYAVPETGLHLELRGLHVKKPAWKPTNINPHRVLRLWDDPNSYDLITVAEVYRSEQTVTPAGMQRTATGFTCPAVFAIPPTAAEASAVPGKAVTVWFLQVDGKGFDHGRFRFGDLPVFAK